MSAIKDKILLATLAHVPFDGWSRAALKHGAVDAGLDRDLGLGAFPGGMVEVAAYCSAYFDRRMVEELARQNILEIFCSSNEYPALKGFEKMALARTGGSCQRSPAKMRLIPPKGLRAWPLRA